MELETIENLNDDPDTEIFYNSCQNCFVFKNKDILRIRSIYSENDDTPIIIERLRDKKLISLNLSSDQKLVAYQEAPDRLEFINLELQQDFSITCSKKNTILGFHWTKGVTQLCDFFMVATNSIEFYKLSDKGFKLVSIRSYQHEVSHYWVEPSEFVVIAAASVPNQGKFYTYFLNQSKSTKFQGYKLYIDVGKINDSLWINIPANSSNLRHYYNSASQESPHQVSLLKLYDSIYFLHMDCVKGRLAFYRMEYEKNPQQSFEIVIQPGKYGIRASDNILVLQNYNLQESYIFDIKSEIYFIHPFATIWHGMPPRVGEITIFMNLDNLDEDGNFSTMFLYDGIIIPTEGPSSFEVLDSESQYIDSLMLLEKELKYVDHDIGFDLSSKKLVQLIIKPETLVQDHHDQVEAILFLLRRTGFKAYSFDYLKDCLRKRIELYKISSLFTTFNKVYKIAALERKKNPNKDELRKSLIQPPIKKRGKIIEPELKLDSGITVILQSDMYGSVFSSLFKEHINSKYLTDVILLYHKSLIEEDIQVHQQLQILLARVLIRSRNFSMLHQFVHFNVFNDSLEFATLMIALSGSTNSLCYPPGLQIGIDMLYRLEAFNALAEALLNNGMIYEALKVLESHPSKEFDSCLLLGQAHSSGDTRLMNLVSQFINEKLL